MRCVPAAQRVTAILNLADETGNDEAVRSDRQDSRVQEICKRRDWPIRDPTWRKGDPTWRKSDRVAEKVNFVQFKYVGLFVVACGRRLRRRAGTLDGSCKQTGNFKNLNAAPPA